LHDLICDIIDYIIWVNAYMIKSDKTLKIEDIESDETFT